MRNLLVLTIVAVLSLVHVPSAHASSQDFLDKLFAIHSALNSGGLRPDEATTGISLLKKELSKFTDKNEIVNLNAALNSLEQDIDQTLAANLCDPWDVECLAAANK